MKTTDFAGIQITRLEARTLLDAAREGAAVSRDWITQALRVTGDLAGPKLGWSVKKLQKDVRSRQQTAALMSGE